MSGSTTYSVLTTLYPRIRVVPIDTNDAEVLLQNLLVDNPVCSGVALPKIYWDMASQLSSINENCQLKLIGIAAVNVAGAWYVNDMYIMLIVFYICGVYHWFDRSHRILLTFLLNNNYLYQY